MFTVLSIEPVASKGLCGAKAQVVTYLQMKVKVWKFTREGFNCFYLLTVEQNNPTEFLPGMLRQSMKGIASTL